MYALIAMYFWTLWAFANSFSKQSKYLKMPNKWNKGLFTCYKDAETCKYALCENFVRYTPLSQPSCCQTEIGIQVWSAQWSKSIRGWQNLFWFFRFRHFWALLSFLTTEKNQTLKFRPSLVPLQALWESLILVVLTEIDGFM